MERDTCVFSCNSKFHGKADLQANSCLKIGLAVKLGVESAPFNFVFPDHQSSLLTDRPVQGCSASSPRRDGCGLSCVSSLQALACIAEQQLRTGPAVEMRRENETREREGERERASERERERRECETRGRERERERERETEREREREREKK